jgi:3-deoxy-D-manno-octulosonic acid kinase
LIASEVFEWATSAPRASFMRPEAAEWAREALSQHATLWLAARKRGPEFTLQGRAPLMVVPGAEATSDGDVLWVIRRYWRGGRMSFLEDRHLRVGVSRPLLEAKSSESLRAKGIATPRVIGGAVYAAGVFYRADLVTEFVPGTVELRTLLLSPEEPWRSEVELRLGAVAKVGALVAQLARAGAQHPDLNAANLLIKRDGTMTTPVVIDLDRCRVSDVGVAVEPMVGRLRRSVAKSASAMGSPFPTEAWSILARAAREGGPA